MLCWRHKLYIDAGVTGGCAAPVGVDRMSVAVLKYLLVVRG